MLRAQAPRSSSVQVRAAIENELGAPIDRLFASFDDEPLASASIGQVHRARLPADVMGGIEVAVKVQHPGIRKAVDSDLANAGILEAMGAVLGARRFDTKTHLDVLRLAVPHHARVRGEPGRRDEEHGDDGAQAA